MGPVIDANVSKADERHVNLGPFFLLGAVLLLVGLLRRRPFVSAVGIGFIWFDQRSEFGLELKRRLDNRLKSQIDP
jgi:hypothetical protein